MAVFGRFQVYYGKIKSELEIIREDYGYTNLSKAFAHWYLVNYVKVSEQELGEIIIDGNGDNGIDAITVNGEVMTLYQFKFPDREKNIEKAIDEKTVLKMFNGYNKLIAKKKPRVANDIFLKYREMVKEKSIFDYKLEFVVFNNSFSKPAEDVLESQIEEIKDKTGNLINYKVVQHKNICEAIIKKDEEAAIESMRKHMKYVIENTL